MSVESTLINEISSTYDDLPYASKPFSQTHPDFLRAVCALFDVATPAVKTANILEIGCSFGGNILPLAMRYPKANIIGLDLSEKQISTGKKAIKAIGLDNIQLYQQDITTYKTPVKHFDYIICHGVYSWVPQPVQAAILRVISEGLTDTGIAIVSYNTYPGWKIREVYRDTMLYRSQPVDNINEKIKYGFGMLDFLKEHLPKESPWGVAMEQHYEDIRRADPSYLAHEYFELFNQPCYFYEFMHLAQEKGLSFIAEADFQNHFLPPVNLDIESYQAMEREANGDVVKLEQLTDFLTNRTFRQTILTRDNRTQHRIVGNKQIQHKVLSELHISGSFFKEAESDSQKLQWKSAQNPQGVTFVDKPITEVIFMCLNKADGQTVKVSELWQQVQAKGVAVKQPEFFEIIAELIIRRVVRVRSDSVQLQQADMDKPCLSKPLQKLFKWMKNHPDTIGFSTVFHEPLLLDVIADELIPLLDGKHSWEDLFEQVIIAAKAGRIVFYDESNIKIDDSEKVAKAAKEHTDRLIRSLSYSGCLC